MKFPRKGLILFKVQKHLSDSAVIVALVMTILLQLTFSESL